MKTPKSHKVELAIYADQLNYSLDHSDAKLCNVFLESISDGLYELELIRTINPKVYKIAANLYPHDWTDRVPLPTLSEKVFVYSFKLDSANYFPPIKLEPSFWIDLICDAVDHSPCVLSDPMKFRQDLNSFLTVRLLDEKWNQSRVVCGLA
jgi:hypothetical protein